MSSDPWNFGSGSAPAGGAGWGDSSSTPTQTSSSWNPSPSRGVPVSSATNASPPLQWLGIGYVLVVASLIIWFVPEHSKTLGLAGWLLAGPLAIGTLAVFLVLDTRRRADPWYAASSGADWMRRGLVVAALVGVTLNAYAVADLVARA